MKEETKQRLDAVIAKVEHRQKNAGKRFDEHLEQRERVGRQWATAMQDTFGPVFEEVSVHLLGGSISCAPRLASEASYGDDGLFRIGEFWVGTRSPGNPTEHSNVQFSMCRDTGDVGIRINIAGIRSPSMPIEFRPLKDVDAGFLEDMLLELVECTYERRSWSMKLV